MKTHWDTTRATRGAIVRLPFYLLPFTLFLSLAAAPPAPEPPDNLIRRANAAFTRGDTEAADALYAAAEERTGDPGLVAFNRAAVLFQRGEFYAAEVHYARTLDDKACPPGRAARAWFNRGTCLLRRGGGAGVYRSAVACFERCLDGDPADEQLTADARHNLELAKLLWVEAVKKAAKPPNPNEEPPEAQPQESAPPPPGGGDPDATDPGAKTPGAVAPTRGPNGAAGTPTKAGPTEVPKTGTGNNPQLQPIEDTGTVQPLSPEDTREYLKRAEERIRKERQNMLRAVYGRDRAGVRDW